MKLINLFKKHFTKAIANNFLRNLFSWLLFILSKNNKFSLKKSKTFLLLKKFFSSLYLSTNLLIILFSK